LIAAIGESAGSVVLHDDKDFDLIAEVTGQSVERWGRDRTAREKSRR
jgi:predicted nucleic acid-binding protein